MVKFGAQWPLLLNIKKLKNKKPSKKKKKTQSIKLVEPSPHYYKTVHFLVFFPKNLPLEVSKDGPMVFLWKVLVKMLLIFIVLLHGL